MSRTVRSDVAVVARYVAVMASLFLSPVMVPVRVGKSVAVDGEPLSAALIVSGALVTLRFPLTRVHVVVGQLRRVGVDGCRLDRVVADRGGSAIADGGVRRGWIVMEVALCFLTVRRIVPVRAGLALAVRPGSCRRR